jgi:hypothetical protein
VALFGLWCLAMPSMASPGDKSAHELYDALNALRIDPAAIYHIEGSSRVELRRNEILISFEEGQLAFLQPLDGRVSGAVFSGRGHMFAAPRDAVEKQQMARFVGAPVLDEDFGNAVLRFTDDTADDLLRQLRNAKVAPQADPPVAMRWNNLLATLNPPNSLRILFDSFSANPRPYFSAAIDGIATGPFDLVIDLERIEPFMLGQPRAAGGRAFYDVWTAHKLPGVTPPPKTFRAIQYTLDTSILPDNSLDAKADVRLHADAGGERGLIFQLSRALKIDSVTGEHGESLAYFQNEGMTLQERNLRGYDYLYLVLPAAPERGSEFTLHFHYRGNVIEDAGNAVLFVGARESWYPHYGSASDFAGYDLTMHWPRRFRLVATGTKLDEHEEGDFRVGHWRSEKPLPVAGFNLGEYASASLTDGAFSVDVFANHELEQALGKRFEVPPSLEVPRVPLVTAEGRGESNMMRITPPPPRPADALRQLGREIDTSIRFYETFSGPFPFQKLSVSQIPGMFGQGWPGLLYLSTYSYLTPSEQQRAGLSASSQEHFTELIPYHEVAHQWWGNVVGWDSYRDQWIDEAIANYLALLFADTQRGADHSLRTWLERYRQHLVEKPQARDQADAEIGALDLGPRLASSKAPNGFEAVVYPKGSWVIHMLHEMLRQPGAKNPDARFIALLHTLATKYAYRALSTADLQREVETVMTPSMDLEGGRSMEWFFEQWVRGTGIPRYRVEFSVRHGEKGYLLRGKLYQDDVPKSFLAPVPLYTGGNAARATLLGVVVATGSETSFHFTTQTEPHKIIIDPQMTLLCVTQ